MIDNIPLPGSSIEYGVEAAEEDGVVPFVQEQGARRPYRIGWRGGVRVRQSKL